MTLSNSPITLLLLTHNNAEIIGKNIAWVKDVPNINEIVVVDDNSSDNTTEELKKLVSKSLKVKIFERGLADDFSAQRQFGVSKAANQWIFWLDPDEIPSKELIEFLGNFDQSQFNFSFKRLDYFLGRPLKHGETGSNRFIRLFRKDFGHFTGMVHEIWTSDKTIISTELIITHFPHPTLTVFFQKINFYSTIRAKELFDHKIKTGYFQIIFYPLGKFIYNYIFRFGFLDGTPGIILCLGMSFHSFLVRSKLWQLYQPSSV